MDKNVITIKVEAKEIMARDNAKTLILKLNTFFSECGIIITVSRCEKILLIAEKKDLVNFQRIEHILIIPV